MHEWDGNRVQERKKILNNKIEMIMERKNPTCQIKTSDENLSNRIDHMENGISEFQVKISNYRKNQQNIKDL